MSDIYVVRVFYDREGEIEGVFSSRENARFFLDYIRDQEGGVPKTIEGPFLLDELVKDVHRAE